MKKYELNYYDRCGCTTTRQEKIIIEANSLEEARDKGYDLPQARRYDNLMVGEYIEGMASYGVGILGIEYINGKQASHKVDIRLFFNAKSENELIRYIYKNYIGKYSHSYTYRYGNELYENCRNEGQDCKLSSIIETYQIGGPINHWPTIE